MKTDEVLGSSSSPVVVAVCLSQGGVPKHPQPQLSASRDGIRGDHQAHAKHRKPHRAVSLLDEEILHELQQEGFDLTAGSIGENILLRNVHVQNLPPRTVLQMGDVQIRLEEPRKPCFVLDVMDERLKEQLIGRCGYMASVVQGGELRPGMRVSTVLFDAPDQPEED